MGHHDQLNQLAARRVPSVVWGAMLDQELSCTIGSDNVLGGDPAVSHLIELGRRRIVFLGDTRYAQMEQRAPWG